MTVEDKRREERLEQARHILRSAIACSEREPENEFLKIAAWQAKRVLPLLEERPSA